MSECDFLGFTIKGKKIRWTDKARAFFKHRVKELTARSWGPCKGVHGLPAAQTGAISSGVDGVLRHQPAPCAKMPV